LPAMTKAGTPRALSPMKNSTAWPSASAETWGRSKRSPETTTRSTRSSFTISRRAFRASPISGVRSTPLKIFPKCQSAVCNRRTPSF
jgi:hypothetical protein